MTDSDSATDSRTTTETGSATETNSATEANSATLVDWSSGAWSNEPVAVSDSASGDGIDVTAVEGSDAWRVTSYGFVHDTEHALLAPFAEGEAIEVRFAADFTSEFDQAGLFVRLDDENWLKAGVEYADGALQLGAVVTRGVSDWSVAPVSGWLGRDVTVRASWTDDAITIRARVDDEPFALVRLAPFGPGSAPGQAVTAGPHLAAPSRAGLTVRFRSWTRSAADASLH